MPCLQMGENFTNLIEQGLKILALFDSIVHVAGEVILLHRIRRFSDQSDRGHKAAIALISLEY